MITSPQASSKRWLSQFFWPFIRIGACFMVAPAFGALFVPPRVRLVLAGAVALLVAPLIPPAADHARSRCRAASSRFSRS